MIEVSINDKIYLGKFDDGILTIHFLNNDDISFFQKWEFQRINNFLKKDHVKDFNFRSGDVLGTYYNCQPILSRNLDCVQLVYDYWETIY